VEVRDEYTPSLYNDPALTERVKNAFIAELGTEQVVERSPAMVGEDFGRFGRTDHHIPICMFRLGTISSEKIAAAQKGQLNLPSLHSAYYAPEAGPSIETGVSAMRAAVIDLLAK
jgi:hippurate hydrolase